jgi:hypothetical protein
LCPSSFFLLDFFGIWNKIGLLENPNPSNMKPATKRKKPHLSINNALITGFENVCTKGGKGAGER